MNQFGITFDVLGENEMLAIVGGKSITTTTTTTITDADGKTTTITTTTTVTTD